MDDPHDRRAAWPASPTDIAQALINDPGLTRRPRADDDTAQLG